MYLGAQLGTMQVEGNEGWFTSSEKYVKSAILNIEETLQKDRATASIHMQNAIGLQVPSGA